MHSMHAALVQPSIEMRAACKHAAAWHACMTAAKDTRAGSPGGAPVHRPIRPPHVWLHGTVCQVSAGMHDITAHVLCCFSNGCDDGVLGQVPLYGAERPQHAGHGGVEAVCVPCMHVWVSAVCDTEQLQLGGRSAGVHCVFCSCDQHLGIAHVCWSRVCNRSKMYACREDDGALVAQHVGLLDKSLRPTSCRRVRDC